MYVGISIQLSLLIYTCIHYTIISVQNNGFNWKSLVLWTICVIKKLHAITLSSFFFRKKKKNRRESAQSNERAKTFIVLSLIVYAMYPIKISHSMNIRLYTWAAIVTIACDKALFTLLYCTLLYTKNNV